MQLREAYEKQLKAREQAETTRAASASKPEVAVEGVARLPTPKEMPSVNIGIGELTKPRKTSEGSSRDGKSSRKSSSKHSKDKKARKALAETKLSQSGIDDSKVEASQEKKTPKSPQQEGDRTEEEEQAGTILIGFLSSLRDSYEDAVKKKGASPAPLPERDAVHNKKTKKRPWHETQSSSKKQKTTKISIRMPEPNHKKPNTPVPASQESHKRQDSQAPQNNGSASMSATSSLADSYRQFTAIQSRRANNTTPAYVTDMSASQSETSSGNNSTNPVESSLEDSDSNSDKCADMNSDDKGKADQSSSEEDDKEVGDGPRDHFRSKGPPSKASQVQEVD